MISKLHDLRTVVRGRVLLPGDDGFDQARRPWNLAVDQAVPAVVEAADAADVAAVVRFARDRGTAVSAQPNGHGATTNLDGAVLLRTHRLTPSRSIRSPGAPVSARACPRATSRPPRRRTA